MTTVPTDIDSTPPAPVSLAERLGLTGWAARQWIELVEQTAEPRHIELGIEISKRRRGPSVRVAPGEASMLG